MQCIQQPSSVFSRAAIPLRLAVALFQTQAVRLIVVISFLQPVFMDHLHTWFDQFIVNTHPDRFGIRPRIDRVHDLRCDRVVMLNILGTAVLIAEIFVPEPAQDRQFLAIIGQALRSDTSRSQIAPAAGAGATGLIISATALELIAPDILAPVCAVSFAAPSFVVIVVSTVSAA